MAKVVARLLSESKPYLVPGKILVKEFWFEVPLDHSKPDSNPIKLFARSATKYEKPIVEPASDVNVQKPYFLFLQGGPGLPTPTPQSSPLSNYMLDRGYELLFLDQRGTGLSSTISDSTLALIGDAQKQADYLKFFRADTIVKDSEAVRLRLTEDYPERKKKWSTWGQSFGGMTTLTYLSFAPEGLRECFITGGLSPLDKGPEEVYQATYRRCMERNVAYYKKFPGDIDSVKMIATKIRELGGEKGIPLPTGGFLTVQRLMTVGLNFGAHGGIDRVHNYIVRMKADLDQFGIFTRATMNELEQDNAWDIAPIYTLLHEPCWCFGPGVAGNWAAERIGKEMEEYQWLHKDWAGPASLGEKPLFFSGEMTYPFLLETCGGLINLKETAHILAKYDQWAPLYDIEQLAKNEVPVYAACYNDMYVDPDLARVTASRIKGIKVFETNVLYHNAVRSNPGDVIPQLLKLRDDTID
ncbi:alpha/beta-hydrolase [Hypoxylon fragiforme]|uniref:alpha/beta-hydrolase n=1 Tax=Hypoxylon fragiforme TaxID=63214 RepID=UPI0020C67B06|nr:alpha/beta-hydrolase [Hypoxylon fragiforme]KAI2614538.1 alpha/beta-hydrolase [Hypoxylon fragiforme]